MTKKTTPIISIRVTEKEKDDIRKLADDNGLTITDYIKQKALYDVTEDNSNTSNTEDLQRKVDDLTANNGHLSDLTEAKDVTISNLNEQLEQANRRLDDYTRLLENQQSLNLATAQSNKDLQLKLETIEEKEQQEEQQKGFFSRLFNRD